MPFGVRPLSLGNPLGNWLRRSGIYLRCIKGAQPDPNATARRLWKDAEKHTGQRTTTYLALLDGAIFAKRTMDFGDFRIQRFEEQEIEQLLDIPTNRVFFPGALQDGKPFCDLWYLVVEEETELSDPNEWLFSDRQSLSLQFSRFPKPVEEALKDLLLWPWWRDSRGPSDRMPSEFDRTFHVPFLLVANPCPFDAPAAAPPLGIPYTEPLPPLDLLIRPDKEEGNAWLAAHPQSSESGVSFRYTGKSDHRAGGAESDLIVYDWQDTEEFEAFVRGVLTARTAVTKNEDWYYFDLALSYRLKAWGAKEEAEQLLWNVVTLESLLGNREHIISGVSRRLEAILGPRIGLPRTLVARADKGVKKLFSDLYDVRCELVHGRRLEKANSDHPRVASVLARKALVKMLCLLNSLAQMVETGRLGRLPSRDEILDKLDRISENKVDLLHPLAEATQQILGECRGDVHVGVFEQRAGQPPPRK